MLFEKETALKNGDKNVMNKAKEKKTRSDNREGEREKKVTENKKTEKKIK